AQFFTQLSNGFISSLSSTMALGMVNTLFASGSPAGGLLRGMSGGNMAGAAMGAGMNSVFSGIGHFFSNLMSFDVGTNYVPHDMVAKIHQGEMIIPKKGADMIRAGGMGSQTNFNGNISVAVGGVGSPSVSGNGSSVHQSLGLMIGEHVKQIILNEQRPGGLLAAK
ncbi:MAG: hypothetical protein KGL39_11290, partial [Patescibacteria group bacterium]|nr:hypothetical protein [Patescibacteria group bacterium]